MQEQITLNIKKLERVDESFYFDKHSTYDLIFKFNGNKFQAVSYNKERQKFVLQAEFHLLDGVKQYKEVLNQTDFLQRDFENVYYVSSSPIHALVPDAFFDANKTEELIAFQNTDVDLHKIVYSNIALLNAKMVYAMDIQELALIRSKFPDLKLLHSSACIFKYIQHLNYAGHAMFINFNEDQFELAVMHHKNCILYNTYKFNTIEDFIYFPLFITEQFGISKSNMQIILFGDVEQEDEKHQALMKYFSSVYFANIDKRFEYANRIEKDQSIHRFANLYHAMICE